MHKRARHFVFKAVAMTILLNTALAAHAQTAVYTQTMKPGGGILPNSQLWIDPTGENDSIAWASLTMPHAATVTRIEWWGQVLPPLGFRVSFFNQDPHTVASQPDIFYADSHPISE